MDTPNTECQVSDMDTDSVLILDTQLEKCQPSVTTDQHIMTSLGTTSLIGGNLHTGIMICEFQATSGIQQENVTEYKSSITNILNQNPTLPETAESEPSSAVTFAQLDQQHQTREGTFHTAAEFLIPAAVGYEEPDDPCGQQALQKFPSAPLAMAVEATVRHGSASTQLLSAFEPISELIPRDTTDQNSLMILNFKKEREKIPLKTSELNDLNSNLNSNILTEGDNLILFSQDDCNWPPLSDGNLAHPSTFKKLPPEGGSVDTPFIFSSFKSSNNNLLERNRAELANKIDSTTANNPKVKTTLHTHADVSQALLSLSNVLQRGIQKVGLSSATFNPPQTGTFEKLSTDLAQATSSSITQPPEQLSSSSSTQKKSFAQAAAPPNVRKTNTYNTTITPECGVVIDRNKACFLDDYAEAIITQLGNETIAFIGIHPEDSERILVFLQNTDLATKLTSTGIWMYRKWYMVSTFQEPATTVTISGIMPFIPDILIINACSSFAKSVYKKLRRIPAAVRDPNHFGMYSFRREAHLVVYKDAHIPESIIVDYLGCTYSLELSTRGVKCFLCNTHGHTAVNCPSQQTKTKQQQQQHGKELPQAQQKKPQKQMQQQKPLQQVNQSQYYKQQQHVSQGQQLQHHAATNHNSMAKQDFLNTTLKRPELKDQQQQNLTETNIPPKKKEDYLKTNNSQRDKGYRAKDQKNTSCINCVDKEDNNETQSQSQKKNFFSYLTDQCESYPILNDDDDDDEQQIFTTLFTQTEDSRSQSPSKKKKKVNIPGFLNAATEIPAENEDQCIDQDTRTRKKSKKPTNVGNENKLGKQAQDQTQSQSSLEFTKEQFMMPQKDKNIKPNNISTQSTANTDSQQIVENFLSIMCNLRKNRRRQVILEHLEQIPNLAQIIDGLIQDTKGQATGSSTYKRLLNIKQDILNIQRPVERPDRNLSDCKLP